MPERNKTKWLTGVGAMVAFAIVNLPPTSAWVGFLLGCLNAGIVVVLGMRDPGVR